MGRTDEVKMGEYDLKEGRKKTYQDKARTCPHPEKIFYRLKIPPMKYIHPEIQSVQITEFVGFGKMAFGGQRNPKNGQKNKKKHYEPMLFDMASDLLRDAGKMSVHFFGLTGR